MWNWQIKKRKSGARTPAKKAGGRCFPRRMGAFVLAAALLFGLVGCAGQGGKDAQKDILSQKEPLEGRIPVTVLVKYAFSINSFEQMVEEKFPDIDIIQVGNYTRDMGIAEYEARLEHDDLTDVVMTWPLDVGQAYWKDRLIDLSGMDFTSKYNLSMLNEISQDGSLYYLPGPAQVRGIVYNKTLFEENGWEVPEDFEGFVALCKTIEASGMRSLQLGFQNTEVLDTAFFGFNYAGSFSNLQDMQWLEEYNSGTGSLEDHFAPAFEVFQRMIDEGIWQEADLEVDYAEREKMLFNRQCAMMEDSVLMARMGGIQTGTSDQFALMPFFSPGEESDWARLYMVCYIGLNKNLQKPENKDKYDAVLRLMDYISTVEGQEALAADTGAMFSSLSGAPAPEVVEIEDIKPALEQGRYAIFPRLENAQEALRQGLADMLRGTATAQDAMQAADAQNQQPKETIPPVTLATATHNFTLLETGNLVTDIMREKTGADIALFMDNGKDGRYNGKGISASLYAGDVTNVDLLRVLPDLKHGEEGVLWTVQMTGENLLNTLEYAIPVDNNQTGWFYYFSGLKMRYNVHNQPGERIQEITLADGSKLENDQVYTIAVMDNTVPEEYIIECEESSDTMYSVLETALQEQKTVSPAGDGRFRTA